MGRESLMTADGYRLLNPDYIESMIFIELEKEADSATFIKFLEQRYGEKLYNLQDLREFLDMQTSSILGMINSMTIIISLITALVIAFILLMVVRTLVLRRKKELGIQKAVGFTTFQLMNQIAGSFVPVGIFGAVAGSVTGCLTMNDCIGLLFGSFGIMKADFIIPIPIIVTASVLICLLIYVVSMFVSARIRRLSPYSLFTET
jgi:putative ABC transport system permease protein